MIKNNTDKTPYELWKGRPANVKHFIIFGRKCYIKREDGRMGKFDSRVDKGILVGYSSTRKASKKEEEKSMEQLFEEEDEDEENPKELEEQFQKVSPKTPSK